MPNNSFVNPEDAERYYNELERQMHRDRRPEDYVFYTDDILTMQEVAKAIVNGSIYEYYAPEHALFIRGYVQEVLPPNGSGAVKVTIRPSGTQTARSRKAEMAFTNEKESVMKVYEGIIVKLDEQGQAAEVLKVIAPFVAKDVTQAIDAIRTDYAIENKLSGKDAAALRVRVREFPIA